MKPMSARNETNANWDCRRARLELHFVDRRGVCLRAVAETRRCRQISAWA
jgi:hypothetical protein